MKYKLSASERAQRITRRAEARAQREQRKTALREWFDSRRALADIRRMKTKSPDAGPSRGVDRVPARYRVTIPAPEVIHNDGTPYRNPERDQKRHARLRTS